MPCVSSTTRSSIPGSWSAAATRCLSGTSPRGLGGRAAGELDLPALGACVLFDGLDEIPDRPSRDSCSCLIEGLAQSYPHSWLIVTSRSGAYTETAQIPGFEHARIEPLEDEAIGVFLRRWCGALYPESTDEAEAHGAELSAALQSRPEIRRLARNPVMLTALAVVHWNERRIPEQRADL